MIVLLNVQGNDGKLSELLVPLTGLLNDIGDFAFTPTDPSVSEVLRRTDTFDEGVAGLSGFPLLTLSKYSSRTLICIFL